MKVKVGKCSAESFGPFEVDKLFVAVEAEDEEERYNSTPTEDFERTEHALLITREEAAEIIKQLSDFIINESRERRGLDSLPKEEPDFLLSLVNFETEEDRENFLRGIRNPDNREEIEYVVARAISLEQALYRQEKGEHLFRLRKALEGIWGHELPEVKE